MTIRDRISRVAIYLAAAKAGECERLESRRQALLALEKALGLTPPGESEATRPERKP